MISNVVIGIILAFSAQEVTNMKWAILLMFAGCVNAVTVSAQNEQPPTYQIDEDYDKFEGSRNFHLSHIPVNNNVAALGIGAAATFLDTGNNRFVIGVGYVATLYGNQQRRRQETYSK